MEPKMQILVLFANKYRIEDERSGEIKEGISVNYYLSTDLKAVKSDNGSVGMRPAKCSLEIDKLPKLGAAPAMYEGTFEMAIGSDGKPVLKLKDVEYIDDIRVTRVSQEIKK